MDKALYIFILGIAVLHQTIFWLLRCFRVITIDTYQRVTLSDNDAMSPGEYRRVLRSLFL